MSPNYFKCLLFFLIPISLPAQQTLGSFQDPRDGHTYTTINIGNTTWFRDNLVFETKNSFCPNVMKSTRKCDKGNYYGYVDKEEVCPDGWAIPNKAQWEEYFLQRLTAQGGDIFDVKVDTLFEEFLSLVHRDSKENINLFEFDNPLQLAKKGWVEGKKIRKWGTTTYWVQSLEVEDKRFHLHVGNNHYVHHRHAHNLDDEEKLKRKFLVRCVKPKE